MTDLRIRTQSEGGRTLRLVPSGEIDMANAEQITDAVEKVLANDRPATLLIDLAAVTLIDSIGMRSLLTAQRIATENSTRLRVANATGGPLHVLTLTGLLDVLSPDDHGAS